MAHDALISIVDDDESIRKATKRLLESAGLTVEDFTSAEDFLNAGRPQDSTCLILDVRLPGISGLELQSQLRASAPKVPIVFITGHGDAQVRARALEAGAIDFLQKPFSEKALFKAINLFAAQPINGEETEPRPFPKTQAARFSFDQIVGRSLVMREMLRLARRVAESEVSSVLLQGDSGTGKDLVAKAIHFASKHADHSFIPINCAALPSHLIESELFGHEKGAFTDAKARKEGLLELGGDGGTIFLDEISELGVNLQAKLLRVLEDGSFRRVGGVKDVPFNARVIAASNRDLKNESEVGRFRLDLYYRLAVIQIDMPRLSERGDDVLLLAQHFITQVGHENIKGLTPEVARAFQLYDWPGNVRELRNVIERATVLEDGDMISTRYLPRGIVPDVGGDVGRRLSSSVIETDATVNLPRKGISLSEVETSLLRQALAQTGGNQTRAAELLGLTRDQFRYRMKKLRESESDKRSSAVRGAAA
jgi:two-component system, NtrC family, response regulator AtoC